jgi:hypothetical protein
MSPPRIALAADAFSIIAVGALLAYLRAREDSIVFATPRSHAGLVTQLPPDAERLSIDSDAIELQALKFQASPEAANQPKTLLSLDAAPGGELGGHSDALYENLDLLKRALAALLPATEKT